MITRQYGEWMYRLLDIYAEVCNPYYPVICVDEKSEQIIEETRTPIPMKPDEYAYGYIRGGARNIFVAVEPKAEDELLRLQKPRKKADFACLVRTPVKNEYPEATKIRIVLDDLNTLVENSLYEKLAKEEPDEILGKVAFNYTRKRASWLNMAETEINIMDRLCLRERIGNESSLKRQINSWGEKRNKRQKQIAWKQRLDWTALDELAAKRIGELVPANPVSTFAGELESLVAK